MATHHWEYLVIELDSANGLKRPRYRNHAEIADWEQTPPYVDYFNQLGHDGWELVTLSSADGTYLFKRPAVAKPDLRQRGVSNGHAPLFEPMPAE